MMEKKDPINTIFIESKPADLASEMKETRVT
jgi:hypothetical protein